MEEVCSELGLGLEGGGVLVDCTAGLGGHASELARRFLSGGSAGGTVVLVDLDAGNLTRAEAAVRAAAPGVEVVCVHGSYSTAPRALAERKLAANAVLADLGFSSSQIDGAGRGFSFRRDEALDMRYDVSGGSTAADLVNSLPEAELVEILREFGEEKAARGVARRIVAERGVEPILTTGRLAEIVRSVVPRTGGGRGRGGGRGGGIDGATRTFQALRIAVNDELASLDGLLEAVARGAVTARSSSSSWLAAGARVGVISFHSLEDRRVKRGFANLAERGLGRLVSKKPMEASEAERVSNPRARSARLRVVEVVA